MTHQPPMGTGRPDDFQTPPEALDYILPYCNNPRTIWECAAGQGKLSDSLTQRGYNVISTDILTGFNFLVDWMEPDKFDMIITNPPYSIKTQFLSRAYLLQKPFAFLLPLTTLETPGRQTLFRKNGIQIIFIPHRIQFQTPSGIGKGAWFATAWFTWGLNLPKDMTFSNPAD
jgi:hypothetical protein